MLALTSINGIPVSNLPGSLEAYCDKWLSSNKQERDQVLHGLFPLGAVQGLLTRIADLEKLSQPVRDEEPKSFTDELERLENLSAPPKKNTK